MIMPWCPACLTIIPTEIGPSFRAASIAGSSLLGSVLYDSRRDTGLRSAGQVTCTAVHGYNALDVTPLSINHWNAVGGLQTQRQIGGNRRFEHVVAGGWHSMVLGLGLDPKPWQQRWF
jgi:hypothetical protein